MSDVPEGYKMSEVGVIPEAWEVKTFGEIFTFLSTGSNSRSDLFEYGEIKNIHYGDIHTKWKHFLDCSKDIIPSIDKDKVKNLPLLEEGDLVMADASEDYEGLGISVEVKNIKNEKVVAGLHTLLLRGDKTIVADGFKGYIQSIKIVQDSLKKISTGISVYGISKSNLRSVLIPLPPLPEQQAIASALSDVDALITSLEQLITKKRNIKQGAMQQLLTGKKRLPGFGGAWEVKKLGDCLTKNPDYGINAPSVHYSDNLPVYIRITDISEDGRFLPEKITSVDDINSNNYFLEKDDLVFARTGASTGKTYLYNPKDGKLVFAGFLIRVKVNSQKLDPLFLKGYTETTMYWHWVNIMSMRSGQPGINGNEFSQLSIPLPPLPEQQAIAQILSDMDTEIESLEQKRDKYKAIKQGMMQELLTGKRRLA